MSSVEMIGRLLVSLAAVLGVVWIIARRARKGVVKGRGNRIVEVLDRTSLSRSASVAVVRVNDQAFVLGVSDAQVSILGETDLAAAEAAREARAAGPRAAARGRRRATGTPGVLAGTTRIAAPVDRPAAQPTRPAAPTQDATRPAGALAGSALSPQTWKQTIESLRDLTARP